MKKMLSWGKNPLTTGSIYAIIKAQTRKELIIMMRTAKRYIFEEMGVEMPKGEINGSWFSENGLPMVVKCSCCGMTMALPSAMVDNDGHCFCSSCSCEFDEPINIDDDFGFDPYEGCYTYDC